MPRWTSCAPRTPAISSSRRSPRTLVHKRRRQCTWRSPRAGRMLVSFWTSRSSIPEIMSWRLLTGLVVAAAVAPAQTKPASTGPQRLDITLERQEGRKWIAVPPGLVFQKNDEIRFRVRPNFDGYLYVMNYGTSGQYAMLFPREETGLQNQIKAGAEYIVPATKTAFRIDGPPGHDIVYWIVSPLSLGDKPGYLPLPP